MKKVKTISMTILLILTAFFETKVISIASNHENKVNPIIVEKSVELLKNGYEDYYEIGEYSAELCCYHEENGKQEVYYLLEISAILKAETIEELDYYNGVQEKYNTDKKVMFSNNLSLESYESNQMLENNINIIKDNLNQYIKKEQKIPFYVKAVYIQGDEMNADILYDDGMEYVEAQKMFPCSKKELHDNGYAYIEFMNEKSNMLDSTRKSSGGAFSVLNAVRYSEAYTSNPTTCNIHQSTCGKKVDTSKYNTNYTHYAANHVDCANFASQIAKAGGIPTDTKWTPGEPQWTSVAGLTEYMVDAGYWKEISYSELSVGDFIVFSTQSHIGFISANDGVQFRYSAHTNDRLNYPLINKSTYKYYRVVY